MMMKMWHSFHMVTTSPWPILISLHLLSVVLNLSFFLNEQILMKFFSMKILLTTMMLMWWKDTLRENLMLGNHNKMVSKGLKLGMVMFIVSEVFFFVSFFWTFFHFFLSPNIELGQNWPPIFISPMNPVGTPLLNTIILLSSGVSITCSHHYLLNNQLKKANAYLALTWALGVYFLYLQFMEYSMSPYTMSDTSYGNIFFMGTGFHGMHVMIGTIYLMFTNYIMYNNWSNSQHLISMDLSAWYWHFVDVVWIYLYLLMYWLPFL